MNDEELLKYIKESYIIYDSVYGINWVTRGVSYPDPEKLNKLGDEYEQYDEIDEAF